MTPSRPGAAEGALQAERSQFPRSPRWMESQSPRVFVPKSPLSESLRMAAADGIVSALMRQKAPLASETGNWQSVRFGEFTLDLRAGELHETGWAKPISLAEQPLLVLRELLKQPGQMVSRDELIQKLWPGGGYGDFDHGLNKAVNKLRDVLGDSAESPKFIETVARRGYRFVATVTVLPDAPAGRPVGGESFQQQTQPSVSWKLLLPGAFVVLLLGIGGYLYFRKPVRLTDKDTIVLADFTNTTGEVVFDGTLRQGLAVQLEQSPFLSLVSDRRIQEVLRLMNQPADARLTFEVAREICERNGSAAVLQGSISSLGTHYVLGLRATNCRTGDVLDEEQVQAARKEAVLDALSQIATKFRSRVGESLATVEKYDTPLPEATTRSLEALKAYSAAGRTFRGSADAVPYFKRAIEIDPNFAMAHALLGRMYSDIGESALSAESTRSAYELQNRVSDKEKFFITTSYSMQVSGNLEQARESCELWAQAYPRSFEPHGLLSGIIYPALGLFDKAGEESKKAVALNPSFPFGYSNLAMSLVARDRLEEAELVLQQGAARGLAIPEFSILRYEIAFLRGDQAAMQREVSLAAGQSDVEDWLSSHQAQVLAYVGRLEEARKVSRRSRDLAQQAGHLEKAAMYETEELVREALFGNHATAKQLAPQALGLSKGRDVEFGVAFGLTLAGNRVDAKNLMQDLARRFPEDTVVQRRYLPTLLAMSALEQGEAAKAIDLLETASPYEFGIPGNSFFGTLGNLYPIYVRGQAYLALHRGSDSSAEFQKIIDRRGIVVSDPVGALAYLQRGRAQAIGSDIPRASATYEGFFKLWKDADTDVAILKQAKAEYAKLQ